MAKVRSSTVAYQAGPPPTDTIMGKNPPVRAKLFANGRSQAVRLPKEFRMPGTEVLIRRNGAAIILTPVTTDAFDADAWMAELHAISAQCQPASPGNTLDDLLREMREDDER